MSAVIVLTPIVISSWPAIAAAVTGAAVAMGFTTRAERLHEDVPVSSSVETELEESEVVAEGLARGASIVLERDGVEVLVRHDERGRCTVCATGDQRSKQELKAIADEVAGRITQQFIYNKLLSELKARDYTVLDQQRLADDSVRVHVRL